MFRFKSTSLVSLALAAGVISAPAAFAATDTSTMQVSVSIDSSCNISTTSDIDFGNQNTEATNLSATGVLSVNCTSGTAYSVSLTSSGVLTAVTPVGNATDNIAYGLYQDAAFTQAWGTGAAAKSGTGTGGAVPLTVYAKIANTEDAHVGLYKEVVTATITY